MPCPEHGVRHRRPGRAGLAGQPSSGAVSRVMRRMTAAARSGWRSSQLPRCSRTPCSTPSRDRPGSARGAFVGQRVGEPAVQQGHLPHPPGQHRERTLHGVEDVGIGPEGDRGPGVRRRSRGGGRGECDAARVLLDPAHAPAPHLGREAARHDGGGTGPHAVDAPADGVPAVGPKFGVRPGQQGFASPSPGVRQDLIPSAEPGCPRALPGGPAGPGRGGGRSGRGRRRLR